MPDLVTLLNFGGFTAEVSQFTLGLREMADSPDVDAATAAIAVGLLEKIDSFQANPSSDLLEELQQKFSEMGKSNSTALEMLIRTISSDKAPWQIAPQPLQGRRFAKKPATVFLATLSPNPLLEKAYEALKNIRNKKVPDSVTTVCQIASRLDEEDCLKLVKRVVSLSYYQEKNKPEVRYNAVRILGKIARNLKLEDRQLVVSKLKTMLGREQDRGVYAAELDALSSIALYLDDPGQLRMARFFESLLRDDYFQVRYDAIWALYRLVPSLKNIKNRLDYTLAVAKKAVDPDEQVRNAALSASKSMGAYLDSQGRRILASVLDEQVNREITKK